MSEVTSIPAGLSKAEATDMLGALFPGAPSDLAGQAPFTGTREAGWQRLNTANLLRYGKTRNDVLDDPQAEGVTRLSPYLRHTLLTLAEVRDHALAVAEEAGRKPSAVEKFINELGWRDFWRRNLAKRGAAVWHDIEPYKTGFGPEDYAAELPPDIRDGQTGIDFVDHFALELKRTGYLHNQMRMKLAAYVVHVRQIRWQAGAEWFLNYLIDGDPASNNLSWQWVASTFAHKPYIFNAGNLRKVTGGRFDGTNRHTGENIFDASYEELNAWLFPHAETV